MKRVILALAASLVWPQASAQGDEVLEFCSNIGNTATLIMTSRQQEAPLSVIMDYAQSIDDELVSSMFKTIAIKAYEKPRWRSSEAREAAISEFSNEAYLQCIKEFKDAK